MKRAIVCFLLCASCGTSGADTSTDAAPGAALCAAEKAWLSRCPTASECERLTVSLCSRSAAGLNESYWSSAQAAFEKAACKDFDSALFTSPAIAPTAEHKNVAAKFCATCRPMDAACVDKFFAGDDGGTHTAPLVLMLSDADAHDLANRFPTMEDAGTCEATFANVVKQMFTRFLFWHCE